MKSKIQYHYIQNWFPFETIFNNGIIKLKNQEYIKILKIIPINFNLKSELEKKSILNSYKLFLKTYHFNFQILIQSNKKDLSNHISNIYEEIEKEDNINITDISRKYIQFIQNINEEQKSSSKNFYLIIKKSQEKNNLKQYSLIIQELNEDYYKIKECLSRCGNKVIEIKQIEDIKNILQSFFNNKNK